MSAIAVRLLTRPTVPPTGDRLRPRWDRQQARQAALVAAVRASEADQLARSGRYVRGGGS